MKLQKRNSMFIKVLALTVAIIITFIAAGCSIGPKESGEPTAEITDVPEAEQTEEPLSTESATEEPQPTESATEEPQPTAVVDRNLPDDLDISGNISFSYCDMGMVDEMPGAVKAVVDAFKKKYPKVKVSCENVSSALISSRIAAGDIGDVFWCDPNGVYTYHNKVDALMPLDSYINYLNIDLDNVYSGALEAGKSDGRLYMVPVFAQEMVMVYNKDMLAAAGIEWDNSAACPWEDFKQICRQLTTFDPDGKVQQCGVDMWLLNESTWQLFLDGFGGTWIDNDNHQIDFINEDVLTGIRELVSAIREGWLYPAGWQQVNYAEGGKYSFNDALSSLLPNVAFIPVNSLSVVKAYGQIYDSLGIDWDICPFPAFPSHKVYTETSGISVYNRTSNPAAAAAFALFFLTPEGQRAFYSQSFKAVPSLKSLAAEDFWRTGNEWTYKNMDAFVSYPDNAMPSAVVSRVPVSSSVLNINDFMSVVVRAADGRADLVKALTSLQNELNRKLIKE